MKRCILMAMAALFLSLPMVAQEPQQDVATPSSEDFQKRYNLLVDRLGTSGVGIETLVQRWEAAYPDDVQMLEAKFVYYLSKSQSSNVVVLSQDKYLGKDPLIPMRDSLGNKKNYFEDIVYDDSLYSIADNAVDKAIKLAPDRLDLRLYKISASIGYEKESPDMAMSYMKDLIDYNYSQHPQWVYPGLDKIDNDVFKSLMQEYCFAFYKLGSQHTFDAFRDLSQKMLDHNSGDPLFMDNLGSYYLVAMHDNKTALKYYNKVLKNKPDDMTAIQNCILLARNSRDVKLEKKYLPMLIKYSDNETDKASASARLDALKKK